MGHHRRFSGGSSRSAEWSRPGSPHALCDRTLAVPWRSRSGSTRHPTNGPPTRSSAETCPPPPDKAMTLLEAAGYLTITKGYTGRKPKPGSPSLTRVAPPTTLTSMRSPCSLARPARPRRSPDHNSDSRNQRRPSAEQTAELTPQAEEIRSRRRCGPPEAGKRPVGVTSRRVSAAPAVHLGRCSDFSGPSVGAPSTRRNGHIRGLSASTTRSP